MALMPMGSLAPLAIDHVAAWQDVHLRLLGMLTPRASVARATSSRVTLLRAA
jgi:hypothetical protein